jgi:hypothetical protein
LTAISPTIFLVRWTVLSETGKKDFAVAAKGVTAKPAQKGAGELPLSFGQKLAKERFYYYCLCEGRESIKKYLELPSRIKKYLELPSQRSTS